MKMVHMSADPADLRRFYEVLHELRTELSFEKFCDILEKARAADGYALAGLEQEGRLLAVMGYRILHDFVHGRHLYIDDLVSSADQRSKGLGARLLRFAEERAREEGCAGLRLCTGIANERGKHFYEREGWALRSVAYKKKAGG